MAKILEKIKDFFKGKKKEEPKPQQEKPKTEEKPEEQKQ